MYIRTIAAVLMIYWQGSIAYEYCTKDNQFELCGEKKHIYCHPEQLVEKEIGNLYGVVPMTPLLKRNLLDLHNLIRNNISCGLFGFEKAARMRRLIWDDELSFLANKHVRECNEQKDNCHRVRRFCYSGQNLCLKKGTASVMILEVIKECLDMWLEQKSTNIAKMTDSYKK